MVVQVQTNVLPHGTCHLLRFESMKLMIRCKILYTSCLCDGRVKGRFFRLLWHLFRLYGLLFIFTFDRRRLGKLNSAPLGHGDRLRNGVTSWWSRLSRKNLICGMFVGQRTLSGDLLCDGRYKKTRPRLGYQEVPSGRRMNSFQWPCNRNLNWRYLAYIRPM